MDTTVDHFTPLALRVRGKKYTWVQGTIGVGKGFFGVGKGFLNQATY